MAARAPTNFASEAKVYDASISGSYAVTEWLEWLRVPPVSGAECARALRRGGFVVRAGARGCAELERDGEVVRVPLTERLSPEVFIAILVRASFSPARFIAALDE
jgi:hypothetical protein